MAQAGLSAWGHTGVRGLLAKGRVCTALGFGLPSPQGAGLCGIRLSEAPKAHPGRVQNALIPSRLKGEGQRH